VHRKEILETIGGPMIDWRGEDRLSWTLKCSAVGSDSGRLKLECRGTPKTISKVLKSARNKFSVFVRGKII
jgi:hypothetical protein